MTSPAPLPPRTSRLAGASLLLGITSLFGAALLLLPPLLAVILGHASRSRVRRNPALRGARLGRAGLVLGYVTFIPALLLATGLLAPLGLPGYAARWQARQEQAIADNLRQLALAADQYYLTQGETTAALSDLVGPGRLLPALVPVCGETYPAFFRENAPVVARLRDGRAVQYETRWSR